MVVGNNLDPLTSSPEMLHTPQNTPEWVTAWLKNLHLNSAEKSDDEIGAYLISKHYTTRSSLKYGILTDPVALAAELGISDVLAGQLCDEAVFITQRRAVPIPVFTTPPPPLTSVPSSKPQKPWTAFTGKFLLTNNELRIPRSELEAIMAQILFHAIVKVLQLEVHLLSSLTIQVPCVMRLVSKHSNLTLTHMIMRS